LNTAGFFDPLLAWIDRAIAEDFVKPRNRDLLIVDGDIDRMLERLFRPLSPHR
jgi:predicted Rossmann-fold nucleotide-binding protein